MHAYKPLGMQTSLDEASIDIGITTIGCFNFFFTRPAFACGFYVRFLFQIPNLINIGHLQTCHGPGLFLGLFYGIC